MKQIRKDKIKKIVSNITDDIEPAKYILKTLNVIHSRLSGTFALTYDGIEMLAQNMNLSVDEVIQ